MDEFTKKRILKFPSEGRTEIPEEYLKDSPTWAKYNNCWKLQVRYILLLEQEIKKLETKLRRYETHL